MKSGLQLFSQLTAATILAANIPVQADPLDNWTTNQLPSNGGGLGVQLEAVTYGSGQYVAVGEFFSNDNGFILTSPDGLSWTVRTKLDYSVLDLLDVTYGNNVFVAAGWDAFTGRNIYTSTNGTDWSPHTNTMGNVFGIAYGDSSFVGVGDGMQIGTFNHTSNNVCWSFDNGQTWLASDSGVAASPTLRDVAFGNHQFVAVDGFGYIYPLFTGRRITNSAAGGEVSFCHGKFFIPAGPGTNLTSADGLTWSAVPNNTAAVFRHVIYTSGYYVAISATNVYSSPDGTNWTLRLHGLSNPDFIDLTSGERNVLLAGITGHTAYLSDPFVSLGSTGGFPPQVTLSGLTGRTFRIEISTNLAPANWQALTNVMLTNGPLVWTDLQATNSARFYRAVLLP